MSNDIVEQSLLQQIAALHFQRVSSVKIAEELKVTRYRVEKIQKSAEYKTYLKELGDRAAEVALASFKSKLEELEPLAYEALKANLKDKKLDAVRIWGEFAGANRKQENEQKDSNLVIVMPGAQAPEKSVDSEVITIDGGSSDAS